jgi:PKHD-type hydroxylase
MQLAPAFVPGAFAPDDCARLIAAVGEGGLREGGLVRSGADQQLRRAEIAWVDDLPGCDWLMPQAMRLTSDVNRDRFGFDLTDFGESAQIARYGAERQGHFGWHSDIGAGTWAAKRKLTIVVQLSAPDTYEGGALEIWPDATAQTAPRAQGLATIFPSFQLHRVTPVTTGTRWSLTLWAHGPSLR